MLATLIPLFDNRMNVCAYSVFAQKRDYLAEPSYAGTGRLDGAGDIVDNYLAFGGLLLAHEELYKGAFAGARRADYKDELAVAYLKVYIGKRDRAGAVLLAYAAKLYQFKAPFFKINNKRAVGTLL